MVDLLILALLAACIVLWREVGKLRERVDLLEGGSPGPRYEVDQSDYEQPRAASRIGRARRQSLVEEAAACPAAGRDPRPPPEPCSTRTSSRAGRRDDADATELKPRLGFEELFGRRLPIWAGGVTLAVAGFLIVKYSIDFWPAVAGRADGSRAVVRHRPDRRGGSGVARRGLRARAPRPPGARRRGHRDALRDDPGRGQPLPS